MKKIFMAIAIFMVAGCNIAPNIEVVEKESAKLVEELLTEDNNQERFVRLDRYFLSEKVDALTYTGTLKATVFYNTTKFDEGKWRNNMRNNRYWEDDTVVVQDSTKFYKTVIVKFRDKRYNYYTVEIL